MAYIQSFQNKEIGDIFKSFLTVLKKGGTWSEITGFQLESYQVDPVIILFENYIPLAFI